MGPILILFLMLTICEVHSFLVLYPVANNTPQNFHIEKYRLMELKKVVLAGSKLTTDGGIYLLGNGDNAAGITRPSQYYFLWPVPPTPNKEADFEEVNAEEELYVRSTSTQYINTQITVLDKSREIQQAHNTPSRTSINPTTVYLAYSKTTIHTVNYMQMKSGKDSSSENCEKCGIKDIGPYIGAFLAIATLGTLSTYVYLRKKRRNFLALQRMFSQNKSVQSIRSGHDVATQCREVRVNRECDYPCEHSPQVLSPSLIEMFNPSLPQYQSPAVSIPSIPSENSKNQTLN